MRIVIISRCSLNEFLFQGEITSGKVGKYTLNARPWSTYNGRPTLEIRGGRITRKIRFDKD